MPDAFLLTRVLLRFPTDDADLLDGISAVHRDERGNLWIGSDEGRSIWRLAPDPEQSHVYGQGERIALDALLDLPGADDEIDIEAIDAVDGFLWVAGSHSATRKKPKGKKPDKDWVRLAKVEDRPARRVLARIPLDGGEGAAALDADRGLMDALAADPHLGRFVRAGLPAKENGLDIEGIAVQPCDGATRVWLGLRGPVLRGLAVLLELEVTVQGKELVPRVLDDEGSLYRVRFLDLDGRGIRELQRFGGDLLVLAGPTMKMPARMKLFRLERPHEAEAVVMQGEGLERVFDLPEPHDADDAEGLTLYPCFDGELGLLVAFDTDWKERRNGNGVLVDVYRLPKLS